MKRFVTAVAVVFVACGSPAPTTTSTPAPRAMGAKAAKRWVAVSVATVWTSPSSPRPVDARALGNPADPRAWVARMSDAQKRDLVGRVQTQALYGTSVIVLGSSGSWSKVAVSTQPSQKDPSGYPGWVPTVQLTFIPPATASVQAIVTSRTAWLYASSERAGGRRLMELSYDTRLPVVRSTDAGVEVVALDGRHRALARDDVALRSPSATRANALGEARKFTGLPYLWGGTSGFGYDCSGFTYSVYHVLGETTSRDADRQALEGRPVPIDSLQPGDLLFVANSRGSIVHNAMYYGVVGGVRSIIESPSTGTPLRVVPLSTHTYVGARRHLSG